MAALIWNYITVRKFSFLCAFPSLFLSDARFFILSKESLDVFTCHEFVCYRSTKDMYNNERATTAWKGLNVRSQERWSTEIGKRYRKSRNPIQ